MLRACIVCLPAAAVINPALGGGIGGTETRAWLFARTLAKRGDTQVTFIVRNRTPMDGTVEGVVIRTFVDRVYNLFEQVGLCVVRRSGFPWLRLRRWRTSLLWQFPAAVAVRLFSPRRNPTQPAPHFQHIDCDVFCTFGVQTVSATVIASAHAAGKRAVLVLGSDGDLDEKFLTDPDSINPYGDRAAVCRFILEQADEIVCQTPDQKRVLKERFGREGVVIENPLDLEEFDRLAGKGKAAAADEMVSDARSPSGASSARSSRPVLWVGRADAIHKRPMLAIDIAKQCPAIPFLLVMNPRDPAEEARVRAAAPANVTIRDRVPPPEMPALMERSLALLNTSSLEGFANTFLQAGAARIPVVSVEVGDVYLRQSRGGEWCAGDLGRGAAILRAWASDDAGRSELGANGRAWVEAHHAAAERAAELRDVLAATQRA
ncbi:hypothetical protein Pan44_17260 [Caulifigura coniformis]|uniref:Spore protein YkvP/CgeB glycosyl transferase-like domain-containing protein n=1 Tax=Caulifigura coniformis TaxID=2527983 RepID=A0A517SC61_9PLAN|nr:glycosyltransferase family 4 protein [Caulifigura coniformis]QDT53703.1 hypothetical protein Pan44_17260 [Caulifigura coniformis]